MLFEYHLYAPRMYSGVSASASPTITTSKDPSHNLHNALDKYPTMHNFVTEMRAHVHISLCTHVHISVTEQCIVGYGTGALWDVCHKYITGLILDLLPGNERRRYFVTTSVIGCAQA